jgi:serine/threonine protein kinase
LDELDDYYGSITPKQPTGLSPAPHFRSFQGFDGKTYKLAYTDCLAVTPVAQQRAIFLADATTGEETVSCVVKFTSSYGQAAHEHMFQRKAAPRLLYCSREPSAGLLFVVVMEFIKGTLRDSPAAYDRNKIEDLESAVRSLHDQNVVFGDLRAPNVVVGEGGALLLVDFDWSGELNVVRYPPSLNPDPKLWAPGVTRGALIKTEHDIWMMDKLKNELVQSLEAQAGRAEAGAGIKRKRDHDK